VELKLAHYMNIALESEEMYMLKWLGIFDEELVGLDHGTPAQIFEHILMKKWKMADDDRDMIVMWHKFDFLEDGVKKQIRSHMILEGEDLENTAMAKTVGLPLGIATKLILEGKLNVTGVIPPVARQLYEPILDELEKMNIKFTEEEKTITDEGKKV